MARRSDYDDGQAAKRLRVPAAAFRWAHHADVIPAPDLPPNRWSRTAVEAMDPEAVRAFFDGGSAVFAGRRPG
ncbi:hypothetical protein OK006_10213 [Actinobacteria bacterium OK006]|nr:hypothetical protein OK006_10213 [Actinobacteria bacterium OK006]